jgi:hypothetical protein
LEGVYSTHERFVLQTHNDEQTLAGIDVTPKKYYNQATEIQTQGKT